MGVVGADMGVLVNPQAYVGWLSATVVCSSTTDTNIGIQHQQQINTHRFQCQSRFWFPVVDIYFDVDIGYAKSIIMDTKYKKM